MSAEVISLNTGPVGAGVHVDPQKVLEAAKTAGLSRVVLVGYDAEGRPYIASSEGEADSLWMLESAKMVMLGAQV